MHASHSGLWLIAVHVFTAALLGHAASVEGGGVEGLQVRGKCFFLEERDLPASTEDAALLGIGAGEAAASGGAYMLLLTRLCSRGFGRCLKLYS